MLKRWVPASFIAVAMALALTGGAVLAFGGSHDSRRADVFERAAAILSIAQTDLQDAHDQARRESQDAQLEAVIERLVAAEVIDQYEADNFTKWVSERPDSANDALFNQLTSSLIGSPSIHMPRIDRHRFRHSGVDDIKDRMAEILGLNPQELSDALKNSETELAEQDHLVKLHTTIDRMLEDSEIDATEADELHAWIDATPQWILDLDISSRLQPAFGILDNEFGEEDFLKRLPFSGRQHFREGHQEFRFEFNGPKGNFRLKPDEDDFPFVDGEFEELFNQFNFKRFEGFEDLDNIEGLEELFERFEGHRFSDPPFALPEQSITRRDTTTTSA